jgi:hypothetical protein
MKIKGSQTKTARTHKGGSPAGKSNKKKKNKIEWIRVEAIVGSILITPRENEALKRYGIDILVMLKKVQKQIYKNPKFRFKLT